MKTVSRYLGQRTLKTAIGAAIAIFISFSIGLSYGVNSGIIVILSVQSTKKKSRDLAIMRIGSTVLALTIGKLVFTLVGFSSIAFGVYLLFFIPIASRLKFHDGIVPCSVLVSHLLTAKSVTFAMLGNEMMQMLIGAGIGFILNFFMPNLEKQLTEDIQNLKTGLPFMSTSTTLNILSMLKEYAPDCSFGTKKHPGKPGSESVFLRTKGCV